MNKSTSVSLKQVSESLNETLVYVGGGSPDAGGALIEIRLIDGDKTMAGEALFEEFIEEAVRASLLMRQTDNGKKEVRDILLGIIGSEL